jgi:hypothetical protein
MDQDVLPTILALFHATRPQCNSFFVPGLELTPVGKKDAEAEFDFLFVREQNLSAGECKAGTELAEKDFRTARMAAKLGVHEFYFCTVREFSERTLEQTEELRSEFERDGQRISIKVLQRSALLGDSSRDGNEGQRQRTEPNAVSQSPPAAPG